MHVHHADAPASGALEPGHAGRLLLICPPFFSYHLAIRAALEQQGWSVTWWSDRASESFGYKLAVRLLPRAAGMLSTRHYLAKLARSTAFDRVLIVKGEALSPDFVHALRDHSPAAPIHLYSWDAVENVRNAARIAPLIDTVATFDPIDAQRLGWTYLPLFASNPAPLPTCVDPQYDWVFVGTLHSDRHRVLHRLRRANPGLRAYVRAFVPGTPLLLARRLTDWTLLSAPQGTLCTVPMSPSALRDVVSRSRAVVDIEHPRQRGLTMRSIETLLGGKKLITTNRHIEKSDLYHPSRVHVVDRRHPIVPPEFFASPFEPIPAAIAARFRLGEWLRELLWTPQSETPERRTTAAALG